MKKNLKSLNGFDGLYIGLKDAPTYGFGSLKDQGAEYLVDTVIDKGGVPVSALFHSKNNSSILWQKGCPLTYFHLVGEDVSIKKPKQGIQASKMYKTNYALKVKELGVEKVVVDYGAFKPCAIIGFNHRQLITVVSAKSTNKAPSFLGLFGLDPNYEKGVGIPIWVMPLSPPTEATLMLLDIYEDIAETYGFDFHSVVLPKSDMVGCVIGRTERTFNKWFGVDNEHGQYL